MKILLKVTASGLVPIYNSDYEEKKKLKIGTEVQAEIKIPRNLKHHRKLFALLRMVIDNLPEHLESKYKTTEDLLEEIKLQQGFFDKKYTLGGKEYLIPRSLRFDKLSQDEFEDFYNNSIDVVLKYFLKGNTKEELINAVLDYL